MVANLPSFVERPEAIAVKRFLPRNAFVVVLGVFCSTCVFAADLPDPRMHLERLTLA